MPFAWTVVLRVFIYACVDKRVTKVKVTALSIKEMEKTFIQWFTISRTLEEKSFSIRQKQFWFEELFNEMWTAFIQIEHISTIKKASIETREYKISLHIIVIFYVFQSSAWYSNSLFSFKKFPDSGANKIGNVLLLKFVLTQNIFRDIRTIRVQTNIIESERNTAIPVFFKRTLVQS